MKKLKIPRLKNYYKKEIVFNLVKELGLKNIMQAPRLKKIVLNMGLGEAIKNPKSIESGIKIISLISGQKPIITKAKKSIASFKLRENMSIGVKVTLRNNKMWEFLDRFLNIALPRLRNFRGISSNFDGVGNFSIGLKEQIVFPEIEYDKIDKIRGLNITLVTTAVNNIAGKLLCEHLGVPFKT